VLVRPAWRQRSETISPRHLPQVIPAELSGESMRILHIIDSGGVYGAERILLYLAREQQRRGHDPVIGSIGLPGEGLKAIETTAKCLGLSVVPIRIASRPTPGVIRLLLRKVQEIAPDVLHSHGYKADILLGFLPRLVRGPMLTTLHGWTAGGKVDALWLYEQVDRISLRRMDAVVVVAASMVQLPALRHVARQRLHVIENGIPPLAERREELAARGVAAVPSELIAFMARDPTVVAIGRLSREKGMDILLEAFAQARKERPSQLLIVGEGPERTALQQRVQQLNLAGTVRINGYLEGADRLLEHAAGFVMSSLTEGMPLVLLEALQWQVPILATRVGAIPQLLDGVRRGELAAPGDAEALAIGLERMLGAPAGARAASAPQTTERFSSALMADKYLDRYQRIRERLS
jgi:glycosyltransferase involved in cell wall biosynthesis